MKNSSKALFQSVVALILCLSMLVGTTMAWFTDSVTSGVNHILSGNLDVELVDAAGNSLEGQSLTFRDVNGNTAILWEPGCTFKTQGFRVANKGSLALEFTMYINGLLGDSELLEVIDFRIEDAEGRDVAIDDFVGHLSGNKSSGLYYLVGHMAESANNDYQGLTLQGVGITVCATQATEESDSFGPDYDEDATFPTLKLPGSITAGVKSENGLVSEALTMADTADTLNAQIPAGVKLGNGVTELTLSVTEMTASGANIQLQDNEILRSLDVHIAGVAADNTKPMQITIREAMMVGLNIGNYTLYHVEDGVANAMTSVTALADLDAHNEFYYDPATGDVTLSLATFSEVAMTVDSTKAWEGNFDYYWYDADATELTIANADQLAAFGAIVGGMAKRENGEFLITYTDGDGDVHHNDSFDGKTVKLIADINLGDKESENNPDLIFYPIGYWNSEGTYKKTGIAISSGFYAFQGTFDGNGNTISNFYQNTWEMKGDHDWYDATLQYFRDGMGLFGKVLGGTIKNLTVDNFSCDSEIGTTGVIAAYADSKDGKPAVFENITITNCNPRVYNIGNGGIVGCAGWYSRNDSLGNVGYTNAVTFRNITVDQTNKISALWGSWGVSCAGILGQYYPNSNCGIKLENCHVAAIIDVNNDVCSNYQYYWYRYAGMFIGTIRANTKDANGYTVADTTGVTAKDCTYTMGNWNEYWYCEIVANSLASYTHDHQFSRLTNITDISEISDDDGKTWKKEGHFALLDENRDIVDCYHIFKNSEGNLYRHFHNVADESNPNIYETFDLNGDGELNDLKEDRQRYFIPFNQLLTGLDMGIKAHTEFEGIEFVENGTVKSEEKFESLGTVTTYRPGQTITLGQLVESIVDDTKLSKASIYAAVSPATENDDVNAAYSLNLSDWKNSTITFAEDCEGSAKIVITDYFYCTATVIYLNPEQAAEKFTANSVSEQYAYTQITLGALFGVKDGATIGNVTATVTDPNGTETSISGTGSDWATKTIDLSKDGTWTVVIKDDDAYCSVTTATFTVNKADKFTKKFDKDFLYRVGNQNAVSLGSLFAEKKTAVKLSSVNVTVENVAGNAAGTFTSNTTWTNGTIQFNGTGVVKVTITALGAQDVDLYLEVVDAVNATGAMNATINNVVLLNNISGGFAVSNGYAFYGNGFKVTCSGKGYRLNYAGMYGGFIEVNNGGVLDNVQVFSDIYPVALLYSSEANDYKNEDVSTTEKNYYNYQLSAVAITGNGSMITNSYVYGGRNNIYVGDGNVSIVNTTTENGVLANIQIKSSNASTVTLKDVTTIQNEVQSTYDTSKTMMGCGILVGDVTSVSNPNLIIQGNWNHYNWVTAANASNTSNTYAQAIINTALGRDDYVHTNASGAEAVNLGMIVLNALALTIDDQRTVKDNYLQSNVTMSLKDPDTGLSGDVEGQVYSVKAGMGDPDSAVPEYVPTKNLEYKPTATKDETVGGNQDTNDGGDDSRYCYWDGNVLKLMYKENESAFALDVAKLVSFTKFGYTLDASVVVTKNGTVLSAVDGKVTFTDAGSYVITYTVSDPYKYDKDGNQVDNTTEWTFTYNVEVSVVKNAGKSAEINVTSTSFYGNYGKTSSLFDPDFHYCIPFMEDVTITDYAEDGVTASEFNVMSNIISIDVAGDKTSGTVTIQYLDGRKLIVAVSGHSVGLGSSGNTISVKSYNSQLWICTDGVSNNATTGTWKVTSYTFTGNNGVTVSYTIERTCNFDSASTTNSPQTSWSSFGNPSVNTIKYTVTYNANGGTCSKTEGYTTSSSTAVTLPTPTRSGYIFAGWYTEASGGTKVGGAGESYTPSANVTLYAQWGQPCTVTYNANGGTCGTTSEKYTGTALTLPKATRDGYWFVGWYDAAFGGNKIGEAGATYNPSSDITLYAHWQEMVNYTVTYNANGGTCGIASATYQGTALTLPTPTRAGYTFDGWYTAASGGTKIGDAGATYTPSASVTLYAQWTAMPTYTITIGNQSNATVTVDKTSTYEGDTVTVTVTFSKNYSKTLTVKDASGNTVLSKSTAGTYTFTMPASNVTIEASSSGTCFAPDTLIALADGTQKEIQDIRVGDMVLAWNFYTGAYEVVPVSLLQAHSTGIQNVLHLYFEDGTELKILGEHGVFDADLDTFVFIDEYDVGNYIGHNVVKQDGDGFTTVKLVDHKVTTEHTTAYTILSYGHYNVMAEGMFTVTPAHVGDNFFNPFDIDEDMKYDDAAVQADIEKYGLYTYEDFDHVLTYEQFVALNIAHFKVSVGKGYITYDGLIYLIENFVNNEDFNI